jgi:hypothetical protein
MSYKSQMLPLSGTGRKLLRWKTSPSWGHSPANLTDMNLQDIKLLRSWLVYDSVVQTGLAPRRINWNMVLRLALATAVSVGIWAGVGLTIARFWK